MVITLNKIEFSRDELKDIKGCLVCGVIDSVDDGGEKFIELGFCNPESKRAAVIVRLTQPSSIKGPIPKLRSCVLSPCICSVI